MGSVPSDRRVARCRRVAVQVGRTLLLFTVSEGSRRIIHGRALCWALTSATPWIVGAAMFPQSPMRGVLWTVAIVVDCLGFTLGYPVPRLDRDRSAQYSLTAEHLAERLRAVPSGWARPVSTATWPW